MENKKYKTVGTVPKSIRKNRQNLTHTNMTPYLPFSTTLVTPGF